MADDLLGRIVREVRERKEASSAAFEESQRLEPALDAQGGEAGATGEVTRARGRSSEGGGIVRRGARIWV